MTPKSTNKNIRTEIYPQRSMRSSSAEQKQTYTYQVPGTAVRIIVAVKKKTSRKEQVQRGTEVLIILATSSIGRHHLSSTAKLTSCL